MLWRVQAGFLDAALQTVDDEHDGIDHFLHKRMGVGKAEREALARRYLQPV